LTIKLTQRFFLAEDSARSTSEGLAIPLRLASG